MQVHPSIPAAVAFARIASPFPLCFHLHPHNPGQGGQDLANGIARPANLGHDVPRQHQATGQFSRRVRGHNLAAVHDQDPVANGLDLRQDVTRQQHRVAARQPANQLPDLSDLVRVQPDGRFIQNQHIGVTQQTVGQSNTLPVPPGQAPDHVTVRVRQPEVRQHGIDPTVKHAARQPLQPAAKPQVLFDTHFGIQRHVLRQIADPAPDLTGLREYVQPGDGHPPTRGRHETGQHPHGGRLAGPVWPQESDNLPALHIKGDIVHGRGATEALGQVLNMYHGYFRSQESE